MHPYLRAPERFLTALGLTAKTPLAQLPPTGVLFEVQLPDLRVEFPSPQRVHVRWTAGGESVHFAVLRKLEPRSREQVIHKRVTVGDAEVELVFRVTHPQVYTEKGQVEVHVSGAFAQALSVLPLELWENVRPHAVSPPLPRCTQPVRATPLPGHPDLDLTVTLGALPVLADVNGVPVAVVQESAGLGLVVHMDGHRVILLSVDGGRSWTTHAQAPGPGPVVGLSAEAALRLRAHHTPRRLPKTVVRRCIGTQEWVIEEPDGREVRVPILAYERVLRMSVAVETEDGRPAGTRVLEYTGQDVLTPSTSMIRDLYTPEGELLHVSALLEPVTDVTKVQCEDLARQVRMLALDRTKKGQWARQAALLPQACLSLLRRVGLEDWGRILPYTAEEATVRWDEGKRRLLVEAYGQQIAAVSASGIEWTAETKGLLLGVDEVSRAARQCDQAPAHEVFRLLTGWAVLELGEREAVVLPVADSA